MAQSDRELLNRQFWLPSDQDPEALPELLDTVRPAEGEKPVLEYIYDRRPPKGESRPMVRCAHCRHRNHWRGYSFRYEDGKGVLIGKDCGGNHYGVWFHQQEKELNEQIARVRALQRIATVAERIGPAVEELERILKTGWIVDAAGAATDFAKSFPGLSGRLLAAHNGRLIGAVQVRDYQAERQRDNAIDKEIERRAEDAEMDRETWEKQNQLLLQSSPAFSKKAIYKREDREVGRLDAHNYLAASSGHPRERLDQLVGALRMDATVLAGINTDPLPTSELHKHLSIVREHAKDAEKHLASLGQGAEFFTASNIDKIARWAVGRSGSEGDYSSNGGTLTLQEPSGRVIRFLARTVAGIERPTLSSLLAGFAG